MSFTVVTKLWVEALMRRASTEGAFSTIERVGDEMRGDVIVKTRKPNGEISLLGRAFTGSDEVAFQILTPENAVLSDVEANNYLSKRVSYDTDLWIVEIEDREGRHFLTERVLPLIQDDPFL
ncbi:DUF1491 family protein [Hirschia litorea]|uniref:DUF1491 family protein n=1 Tax=Hirschia litorea TaxID=1199156 RepID=A0ABW2IIH7_9PROT